MVSISDLYCSLPSGSSKVFSFHSWNLACNYCFVTLHKKHLHCVHCGQFLKPFSFWKKKRTVHAKKITNDIWNRWNSGSNETTLYLTFNFVLGNIYLWFSLCQEVAQPVTLNGHVFVYIYYDALQLAWHSMYLLFLLCKPFAFAKY